MSTIAEAGPTGSPLVVAVEGITSARSRASQPSDGGSTGVSDTND
jgi:hypothetical protein